MSATYSPDEDALQQAPWTTVFLSSRDLSAQIPINFVTHPGVTLTAACFGNGIYDSIPAQRCLSNLLAAQFRRFVIDLYWDPLAQQFHLCPVAIPEGGLSSPTTGPALSSATAQQLSSAALTPGPTSTSTDSIAMRPVSTGDNTGDTTAGSAFPTAASTAPIATVTSPSGTTLFQLGKYQCDPIIDPSFVISIVLDYLQKSSDTIHATLLFFELNLHAAALSSAPDDPAPAPAVQDLPQTGQLASTELSNLVQSFVYTPTELLSQRSNLNDTWYRNPEARFPIAEYFATTTLSDGNVITPDGYPDEDYIQLTEAKRLLFGWGRIDPQMAAYNISADAGMIFSPGTLSSDRLFAENTTSPLSTDCFYSPGDSTIAQVNSSWAVASILYNGSDGSMPLDTTSCGISPLLNQTIGNHSADQQPSLYVNFTHAVVWNWAPGEPRNYSQPGYDLDNPESQYRCALLDTSSAYGGRWRVEDCQKSYRVACRIRNSPYQWQLSSSTASFGTGASICPDDSSFSIPRTGLEQTYLYNHIMSQSDSSSVWINFNSLYVQACWVTTGPNGTCPYYENPNTQHSRQVIIPTIAAIIALILTALTLFVKCNFNRRNSRARKRGEGGWDYEGVPS